MNRQPQAGVKIRRSRKQWEAILSDFNTSALSASAYCEKNAIAYASFAKWRSLLKASKDQKPQRSSATQAEAISFIELPREPNASSNSSHWDIELELGKGVVLRLRSS